ncbi:MAG: DUF2156 domain-containing protein [Spirochaetales bacterium]|nr:DUF2156 domain-containing protein [Spirochaetales bacterium]
MLQQYPQFSEITLPMRPVLQPVLKQHNEGISEFTFNGIYLFRKRHNYEISQLDKDTIIITGQDKGNPFFMLPALIPRKAQLDELFSAYKELKAVSETKATYLLEHGYTIREDRDNFDYLYLRTDLAKLPGKKYHKKRNHVKAFINSYSYEGVPFLPEYKEAALAILDGWRATQDHDGDYASAREALELYEELDLCGVLYFVEGTPAAYILGEELVKSKSYVIHFEKALTTYRGIYQFVNKSFSSLLPDKYKYINREQDLGNEGLRQAKMSYRPCGFVKKYRVTN